MKKRTRFEQVEARLLFAGVTVDAGPVSVATVSGQFVPLATAAVGTAGNALLVLAKNSKLFGQILASDGTVVVPEFQISGSADNVVTTGAVAAAAMPDGNVAVAYQTMVFGTGSSQSDFGNIELAVVTPAGTVPFAPVQVAPSVANYQNNPSIAVSGTKIGVSFTSAVNLGTVNTSVFFDRYSGDDLSEIGTPTQLNVAPATPPYGIVNDHSSVAFDPSGNALVAWNQRVYDPTLTTLSSGISGATINGTTGVASSPFSILQHSGNLTIYFNPTALASSAGFGCAIGFGDFDQNFALTDSSAVYCDFNGDGTAEVTTTVAQTDASAQVGVAGAFIIPSTEEGQPPIVFIDISRGVHSSSGIATAECDFGLCSADPNFPVQVATGKVISATTDVTIAILTDGSGNVRLDAYNRTVAGDFSSTAVDFYGGDVAVPLFAPQPTVSIGDATNDEDDVDDPNDVEPLLFPITLSSPSDQIVQVHFRTLDSDPGTTVVGHYSSVDTVIAIPVGQTHATAHVSVSAVDAGKPNDLAVSISVSSANATLGTARALGSIPHFTGSDKSFDFSLSLDETDLYPGASTLARLMIAKSSTAPSNSPKTGSGEVKVSVALPGGGTQVVSDTKVKINLAKADEQTTSLKVKLPAVLAEGTLPLSVTFVGDAKSGITAANSQVSVTPGTGQASAAIDVSNIFSNGTILVAGDPDGTAGKFSLKGPGQGHVVTNSDGTVDLVFTGTTAATIVTISAPTAGKPGAGTNGRFDVRNITTDGPIGKVSASCVDVSGNISLGGPITMGMFGNIKDGHVITLPTSSTVATLTFLSMANVTFNSGQPIGNLTVKDWTDTDSTVDVLTAPSIVKLMVAGNFEAGLAVAGTVVNFTVGGTLGGTTVHTVAAANFGKVMVGSVRNTDLFAGVASSGLPTSAADFTSAASNIVGFSMKGTFSNSSIAAKSIGTLALTSVTTANDSSFGVTAEVLKAYTRDKAKKAVPTSPGLVDSAGQFSVRTVG